MLRRERISFYTRRRMLSVMRTDVARRRHMLLSLIC